jgi:D-alanyl-D-alanine carboxypeptidase
MSSVALDPRVTKMLEELAVPEAIVQQYKLPPQWEGDDLVSIGLDMFGREQRLDQRAAAQWQAMMAAAGREGIVLLAISGFRSYDYQRQIITRHLAKGRTLEDILRANALPGFSEHHTGRAIDIGAPGSEPLTEAFGETPAFLWLTRRARAFGFSLTYPRDNPLGIIYEPWHWCWTAPSA